MAETNAAKARREKENFFQKYCQGNGIDIGWGDDPLTADIRKWDKSDGDATFMEGVPDATLDFAYSSHCLEHLNQPHVALRNWLRIVKTGGYLIIFIPHRDRYERRLTLPSRFNGDHRTFWLPDRSEPPCTIGLIPLVAQWLICYELIYCKVCDTGWVYLPPEDHAHGEYSIECVLRKT